MSKVYWLCLYRPRMMKSVQLFSEPKHFKIVKCWNQNQWAIPKERKWKMKKVIPRWSAVLTIGASIPCRCILITISISIIIYHTFSASRWWSLCEELKYIYIYPSPSPSPFTNIPNIREKKRRRQSCLLLTAIGEELQGKEREVQRVNIISFIIDIDIRHHYLLVHWQSSL